MVHLFEMRRIPMHELFRQLLSNYSRYAANSNMKGISFFYSPCSSWKALCTIAAITLLYINYSAHSLTGIFCGYSYIKYYSIYCAINIDYFSLQLQCYYLLNLHILTQPVNFPCGRKPEYFHLSSRVS